MSSIEGRSSSTPAPPADPRHATEVIADLAAPLPIREEFIDLAPPARMHHRRDRVFVRGEEDLSGDAGSPADEADA